MIPKIIHHVWPGSDTFKEKFHAWRQSWIKYHPDWTFYFWRIENFQQTVIGADRFMITFVLRKFNPTTY